MLKLIHGQPNGLSVIFQRVRQGPPLGCASGPRSGLPTVSERARGT